MTVVRPPHETGLPQDTIKAIVDLVAPGGWSTGIRRLLGSFSNLSQCLDGISATGTPFRVVIRPYADFGGDRAKKARTEYHALRLVRTYAIPASEPLFLDHSGTVLGSPGIVTSFVPGTHVVAPADPVSFGEVMAFALAAVPAISVEQPPLVYLLDANTEALWFLQEGDVPAFIDERRHKKPKRRYCGVASEISCECFAFVDPHGEGH